MTGRPVALRHKKFLVLKSGNVVRNRHFSTILKHGGKLMPETDFTKSFPRETARGERFLTAPIDDNWYIDLGSGRVPIPWPVPGAIGLTKDPTDLEHGK